MLDASFWVQFVAFLVAGGAGLVIINNIAQISLARGGDDRDRSHCRFVLPFVHVIPDLLTYSVPVSVSEGTM